MADAMVEQVRRFNRVVTARVGALNDHFLGRSMALGEARLLWEIGAEGCEVRVLRARLEIVSIDPEHPDARSCLAAYVAELNRRSSRGFDPTVGATALPHELRPP